MSHFDPGSAPRTTLSVPPYSGPPVVSTTLADSDSFLGAVVTPATGYAGIAVGFAAGAAGAGADGAGAAAAGAGAAAAGAGAAAAGAAGASASSSAELHAVPIIEIKATKAKIPIPYFRPILIFFLLKLIKATIFLIFLKKIRKLTKFKSVIK